MAAEKNVRSTFKGLQLVGRYVGFYKKTSEDGLIILEKCNDDNTFYYYNIDPNTGNTEYYGLVDSIHGIFDENYNGYPERDENGIIELDTDFC